MYKLLKLNLLFTHSIILFSNDIGVIVRKKLKKVFFLHVKQQTVHWKQSYLTGCQGHMLKIKGRCLGY